MNSALNRPAALRLDLRKGWPESLVALDGDHCGGAFEKKRAGQAARSWADFKNRGVIERPGAARDSPRHIKVEDEILAERLPGGKRGLFDDLAKGGQRRYGIGQGHGWDACAEAAVLLMRAARRSASMKLAGSACPVPASEKAVP